jgi:hypothetical protein
MRGVVRALAATERNKKTTDLKKEGIVIREVWVLTKLNDRWACIEQVKACKESDCQTHHGEVEE